MSALKCLFLLGVSFAACAPGPEPAAILTLVKEARDQGTENIQRIQDDAFNLEKRVPGRMTLQWNRQGIFFFNVGLSLPNTVTQLLANSIDVARELAVEFDLFSLLDRGHHSIPEDVGGLYSINSQGLWSFGVGVILPKGATDDTIEAMKALLIQFGKQHGGLVQVIERANGALDPSAIGYVPRVIPKRWSKAALARRTRADFCPTKSMDLLQYSLDREPFIYDLRWVERC